MSTTQSTAPLDVDERDWCLSTRSGWFAMATTPARTKPPVHCPAELAASPAAQLRRYNQARAVWHANLGPIRTPGVNTVFDTAEEICGANRQDGDKVKPAVVLDALPGLGKSTAATAFGRAFHLEQIDLYGPVVTATDGQWQRVPVV